MHKKMHKQQKIADPGFFRGLRRRISTRIPELATKRPSNGPPTPNLGPRTASELEGLKNATHLLKGSSRPMEHLQPSINRPPVLKSPTIVEPKTPERPKRTALTPQARQFMRAELSNDGQTINLPSGRLMQVKPDISSSSSDKTEDGDPFTSSVAAPQATMANLPSSPLQVLQNPPPPPASRMSRRTVNRKFSDDQPAPLSPPSEWHAYVAEGFLTNLADIRNKWRSRGMGNQTYTDILRRELELCAIEPLVPEDDFIPCIRPMDDEPPLWATHGFDGACDTPSELEPDITAPTAPPSPRAMCNGISGAIYLDEDKGSEHNYGMMLDGAADFRDEEKDNVQGVPMTRSVTGETVLQDPELEEGETDEDEELEEGEIREDYEGMEEREIIEDSDNDDVPQASYEDQAKANATDEPELLAHLDDNTKYLQDAILQISALRRRAVAHYKRCKGAERWLEVHWVSIFNYHRLQ